VALLVQDLMATSFTEATQRDAVRPEAWCRKDGSTALHAAARRSDDDKAITIVPEADAPGRWNRSESALSWSSAMVESRLGTAELSGSQGCSRCATASWVRRALRSCCITGDVREEKAGSHSGAHTRESDGAMGKWVLEI
jgi:hypothetical protein